MGYIKKLKNNELVGGTDKHTIYPVTSTKAVFEEVTEGDKSSFKSQETINGDYDDRIKGLETVMPDTVKSITINGGQRVNRVDENGNVDLTIYSDGGQDYESLTEVVADLRDIVGENPEEPQSGTLLERVDTLEEAVGTGGSVDQRISNGITTALDSLDAEYSDDGESYIDFHLKQADGKIDDFEIEDSKLQNAITSLTNAIGGGNITLVESLPTAGDAGKIYRVVNNDNTYTDYMYVAGESTPWKPLAVHDLSTIQPQIAYYTCTASGSGALETKVFVSNGSLTYSTANGGHIKIKMGEANTHAAPVYLKFNTEDNTSKQVYYNGEPVSASNTWEENEVISVYYDGTYYQASNAQGGGGKAEKIKYDNSQSGLAAENVQEAVDEISDTLTDSDDVTISDMSLFASGINIAATTYQTAPSINLYRLDLTGLALQSDGTKGKLKVTSTPNQSWFAVMNTCNTPVNGAPIGTFATGYSERTVMPASTTDTFVIPADCNYILFPYNPNTAVFPTAISIINTFSCQELKDLEDDVKDINKEIYVGGNHIPASVSNPTAALTGVLSEDVLTLTQNSVATGFVTTDMNTNGVDYTIKFSAKMVNGTSQTLYVGIAASVLSDATKSIRVSDTEYADYEISLKGSLDTNPSYLIAFTIIQNNAVVGNIISVKDIVVTFEGETKSILERLNTLEEAASGGLSYTFNTDAFLQGCDRYSKYLTKICCAGDSLIANAIGGSIPSSVDEGADNRRPMRLLTNGVARRLYDYISWNKPIWRRLDHSDWTKSGWTAFTSSQMNTICQGTNPSLWKATSQGSYAEITVPEGYEHFAIIVRLKSGNGTLDVTLNGGDVGTYTNPYYTSKVATNSVVNASVVPQYVARGLSAINTNSGTTATGNIYHIVEYNNLPSGQANTLRFTTASATEVDIWGGFYWSGNTCVVMNIAQGGHTTSDLLNDHLPDELFAEDYDAVLFEVTEMNNLRLSIAQTKIDLQTIITTLRDMGVDHCFTSCNPLGLSIEHDTNFYTTYSNPSQLDVNNAVSELMKEQAEAFIDVFQYFRWHIERRGGTLVGGQGGLWYTWDGQHGNAAGVKLWFDALIKVIAHKSIMID